MTRSPGEARGRSPPADRAIAVGRAPSRWPPAKSSRRARSWPPIRSTGTPAARSWFSSTAGHAAAVVGDHDPASRHQAGAFTGQGGIDHFQEAAVSVPRSCLPLPLVAAIRTMAVERTSADRAGRTARLFRQARHPVDNHAERAGSSHRVHHLRANPTGPSIPETHRAASPGSRPA